TLHMRIVEACERLYPERLTDQVERLAQHALRGEVWDKAVTYCQQAGTKALHCSVPLEAQACFEQALSALQHLPTTRDTVDQTITLRVRMRHALFHLGEFRRALTHLRDAERLVKALDDPRRLGGIYVYLVNMLTILGEPQQAVATAQRARAIAIHLRDRTLESAVHTYSGEADAALGDYRRAIDCARANVTALQTDLDRPRVGTMFALFSRSWLMWSYAELGEFAAGFPLGEEALRLAAVLDLPHCLFQAYYSNAWLYLCRGEVDRALPLLERNFALSQDASIPNMAPWTASALGYAYALCGRIPEALPLLEQAVQQSASMHFMFYHALRVTWLSEAYLRAGRLDEAYTQVQRALEFARAHMERGHEAHALRLLGEIAAHCRPPGVDRAAAHYQQALALAEALGMRPLQAHCHRSLGTLYAATGQREQARTELSAAVDLYQAMEMTFWLPETEAALAQVEGR